MSAALRWTLAGVLLFLSGCSGGVWYRYVDIQAHPAQAADQVAVRAHEMGYEVGPMQTDPRLGFELYEIRWLTGEDGTAEHGPEQPQEQDQTHPAPAADPEPEPEAPAPIPTTVPVQEPLPTQVDPPADPAQEGGDPTEEPEPIEGLDYERLPVATVEVHPTEEGSRVAIHSELFDAAGLEELLPGGPALTYETALSSNPITQTLAWDLVSNLGWRWSRSDRDDMHALDLDASLRLGARLARFGGGGGEPAPAYSLALLGGLGVGLGNDGVEFRPALMFSLDRQETANPVGDQILATGQQYSLDLGLQAMLGDESRGLTGRLEFRHTDTFGIFLAAGYQYAPEASPIFSLGVTLGPMPMAAAGAMLLYAL